MQQEDAQHLAARNAHRPQDADLSRLLHHRDHQHTRDANATDRPTKNRIVFIEIDYAVMAVNN